MGAIHGFQDNLDCFISIFHLDITHINKKNAYPRIVQRIVPTYASLYPASPLL
jgi:hypothetical protein